MEPAATDVTLLLKRFSSGDEQALAELIPQIYDELRRLASFYLQRMSSGGSRPSICRVSV